MCLTPRPVSGSEESLGCVHGVTLQAAPGHIWPGKGSPALTPAHLELTHSETARRCINNTHTCVWTYVQYVLHGKYTNADRHARLRSRTNTRPHACVVCVYLNAHTCRKTKCMWNHVITHTYRADAAGPSYRLMSCEPAFLFYVWKETCVLSHCLREKYEQVLQLFEGHFNLPEEPADSAGQDIPN